MIVPLKMSHYLQFDGKLPPSTVRGIASIEGDTVYAICSVSVIDGVSYITFGVKPGVNKRDIIKGWNIFKKTLDERKTYYAIIDRDLPTAPALLNHFNFAYVVDDLYVYEG